VIYRFNAMPIKIPMSFFAEIEKPIIKYIWKNKKTLNNKNNPEQKEQCWRHHNTGFKLYYGAIVTKQYGTGTKTDMKINGTEQNTQE
jgi:hypothetical protein